MTTTMNGSGCDLSRSYDRALLRTLHYAGVKFLRYMSIDMCNTPRCKAVPLDHLLASCEDGGDGEDGGEDLLGGRVAIARACFGALPPYADYIQPASGLDASGTFYVVPDVDTLRVLPYSPKSAVVLGNLMDPYTDDEANSDLCCRSLLRRVVCDAARDHNVAFGVGAEIEFCLYDGKSNRPVDLTVFTSPEILNRHEDFVATVYDQLAKQHIRVEQIHSESSHGQLEVVVRYANDPVKLADDVVLTRETIKNVARQHGLKALFLPKIDLARAGNGCHLHLSLRNANDPKGGNIFYEADSNFTGRKEFMRGNPDDISPKGRAFMEGILQHLPGLLAATLPTTNSFRRVGRGCWTGSQVGWGFEDKEASLRVVASGRKRPPVWEHFEYKLCDNTANPYLALAAIILAGVDGISRGSQLRPPLRDDPEQGRDSFPETIGDCLKRLEQDEFLMKALPASMTRAYLVLRRAEADRAADMKIEDEVKEALDHA